MNHVPDLCAERFPLAFSCNRLPSVFFPRPGTSFGESVLLLFGERNATARDWVATLRRWFMEDRGENFPPRSVRRVVGSSVALLGLSAPEACGGTSHFPICPHMSPYFLYSPDRKILNRNVNVHYWRYPMVSPQRMLESDHGKILFRDGSCEQRCSCIWNGRNASTGLSLNMLEPFVSLCDMRLCLQF